MIGDWTVSDAGLTTQDSRLTTNRLTTALASYRIFGTTPLPMKLIIRILLSTIAVLVADLLLSGVHAVDLKTSLLVAVVLGVLNAVVRPIIVLLTLPVTVVTLGLFVLVINAAMVMLAARIVPGFVVNGFWWALAFSVVMWAVQSALLKLDGGEERR